MPPDSALREIDLSASNLCSLWRRLRCGLGSGASDGQERREKQRWRPVHSSAFEYEPLGDANEIRLVFIRKSNFTGEWQLAYHIVHARIDSDYTAVSYTWGDPNRSRWIHCNQKLIRVPLNCEDLLKSLADADIPGPFWIDALSIDMDNIEERNEQAGRIADIFIKASRTVVYLGRHDSHSARVVQLMPESSNDDNFITSELNPEDEDHARKFLQRPWFSRTWAMQEVLFSRNSRVLVGGAVISDIKLHPSTIDLQELPLLAASVHMTLPNVLTTLTNLGLESLSSRQWKSFEEWQLGVGRGTLCSATYQSVFQSQKSGRPMLPFYRLHELMEKTRGLHCFDPRDRIFAMISLFQKPIPKFITPDYAKSIPQVYTDLMWFFIRLDISDALNSAGPVRGDSVLPSWVVDWRQPLKERPMKRDSWRAGWTPGHKHMVSARYGNVLALRGVQIGKIAAVGTQSKLPGPGDRCSIQDASAQIETWKVEWQSISRSVRGVRYTLQQTERRKFILRQARELEGDYRTDSVIAASGRSRQSSESVTGRTIENYLRGFETRFYGTDQLAHPCINRRPIILNDGSPGLGPAATVASDEVCVFLGVPTPFVVRPLGDKWYIVGQCLVEGIMHGEAVKDVDWDSVSRPVPKAPLHDFFIH
ncbi:uncharacterized protein MYCFIDRAFT_214556 [Pseudocercospora fijiensis CIRAD86]|uniref:Heterokaryon incompatibility domain-containing protein n=1 Tax=Pseudocercospora fijiensis (strain CIRAD86) TaxID=383855 RepID=M3B3J4_PSEFD|nr:uncharacterized protein MYCFIDRAFT_214556 [Pseudocercospora fijiensis CIRAD86]EME83958.1 hypothetical protein MYCFIDRAFT_214556 [Pseudocercospora fijiensis CIRAD86]